MFVIRILKCETWSESDAHKLEESLRDSWRSRDLEREFTFEHDTKEVSFLYSRCRIHKLIIPKL